MVDQRRLILGNGEAYIKQAKKTPQGRPKEPPRSYGEARDRLKAGIGSALRGFESLPETKKMEEEAVFCMRLHPDVTAKTYDPSAMFDAAPQLRSVGSRPYRVATSDVAQTKRIEKKISENQTETEGRAVFVQSTPEGFDSFLRQLDRPESRLTEKFRREIQQIELFNELSIDEQFSGFTDDWTEGRAELVIHPSRTTDERQLEFLFELFEFAEIDHERCSIRQYPGGPTFVSCPLDRESLAVIAGVNPLRAAHPLRFGGLNNLRNSPTAKAPRPPASTTKSTIKVGMFDGGIDPNVPLLSGHAEEDTDLSIGTPPDANCVAHGTAVAGAILHGALNGSRETDRLHSPPVYVVSFRALPTSDTLDVDMYECIDVIEQAVPARQDIKVFNVSFGPIGPIDDDPVSRFTYVLDTLAHSNKVTFCVAAGNTGHVNGEERIQAPSDMVHGFGVGAYTIAGGEPIHAYYSCQGPGRECGKIKPDLTAFGGCDQTPIHLVSTTSGMKLLDWGTSFAAPLVSRLSAQAIESVDRSSALLSRALLIHTAEHPKGAVDGFLGHGTIVDSIDDVVQCRDNAVTVVFQGAILPTKIVQLPIPWPSRHGMSGNVQIAWTIAALSPIDPMHPGDYTSCCLEETFYPNSRKFEFRPPKSIKEKKVRLHLDEDEVKVASLLSKDWKKSDWPLSESGNTYKDEEQKRAIDCKWESIVRRFKSKKAVKVEAPLMTLHAIGRNGARDRFDYAVVVTLTAKSFDGDLYTAIREQYPALLPIRLRTEAETRIQI